MSTALPCTGNDCTNSNSNPTQAGTVNLNAENPTCANTNNYRYLEHGVRNFDVYNNAVDFHNAAASSIYIPPLDPLNGAQQIRAPAPMLPLVPLDPHPYKSENMYTSNPAFKIISSIPWLINNGYPQQLPVQLYAPQPPFAYFTPSAESIQRTSSNVSYLSAPELSSASSSASSASSNTEWPSNATINRDTIPLPVQPILNGTNSDSSVLEFINNSQNKTDEALKIDDNKREIEADITWNQKFKNKAWLRQNRSHQKQLQASGFKVLNLGVRQKVCSICHMSFSKEMFVWRHASRHIACKPFHCAACNQRFTRSDTLQRHVHRTGHSQQS